MSEASELLRVSRLAVLYWEDGSLRLFSARSGSILRAPLELLQLLNEFRLPSSPAQVAERRSLPLPALLEKVELLRQREFLVPCEGGAGEHEGFWAGWEIHDALAHVLGRGGTVDIEAWPLGGTYRFEGRLPSPPARHGYREGSRRLPLPEPSAELAFPSLAEALARRRSERDWSSQPPPLQTYADLLHHAVRTQRLERDALLRPYPSGGARHSLSAVVVAGPSEGFPGGVWRYDAEDHQLEQVAGWEAREATVLLEAARLSCGAERPPPALLLLSSRFARVQHKYQRIAYSLILKEAGALLQTLYLVGGALGLACCALGSGPNLFSRLNGTHFFEESVVGELALGEPAPRAGAE